MIARTAIAVCLVALAALALTQCAPDPIHAQVDAADILAETRAESPRRLPAARITAEALRAPPTVILAAVAWSEAGAYVSAGEVAAMHQVLTTSMTDRTTYQRRAWAYSHGLRHPRHGWLLRLGRGTPGPEVPGYVREGWPRILAAAEAAIAGQVTHGCDASPLRHWGGPRVDRLSIRALTRRGWRVASCPSEFKNSFLARDGR